MCQKVVYISVGFGVSCCSCNSVRGFGRCFAVGFLPYCSATPRWAWLYSLTARTYVCDFSLTGRPASQVGESEALPTPTRTRPARHSAHDYMDRNRFNSPLGVLLVVLPSYDYPAVQVLHDIRNNLPAAHRHVAFALMQGLVSRRPILRVNAYRLITALASGNLPRALTSSGASDVFGIGAKVRLALVLKGRLAVIRL